ncbi:MAG: thioredoxin family protein, partial [Bdellovibrionales bacterium]|nr:thioredoxin family protein [Bdellovibrionales bacterium]
MAKTPSTMLELGTPAPEFSLPCTVSGRNVRLADFSASEALLVMFLSNHCPFVKHIQQRLVALSRKWQGQGLGVVAISSNDVSTHPEDGPALMKEEAQTAGYSFPYLYDESQTVAKSYQAACTPDFFLFDSSRRLVYRG